MVVHYTNLYQTQFTLSWSKSYSKSNTFKFRSHEPCRLGLKECKNCLSVPGTNYYTWRGHKGLSLILFWIQALQFQQM